MNDASNSGFDDVQGPKSEQEKTSLGAFYTPPHVVEALLDLTLDPLIAQRELIGSEAIAELRVFDPTCGSGNFLHATMLRIAAALDRAGSAPVQETRKGEFDRQEPTPAALGRALRCVAGTDIDPRAIEACNRRLGSTTGTKSASVETRAVACDSLLLQTEADNNDASPNHPAPHRREMAGSPTADRSPELQTWASLKAAFGAPDGFDLVIGNPPFLGQLQAKTAFSQAYAREVRHRFGPVVTAYTDPAALFLLIGARLLRNPGGRLCLIEPVSVLSNRDATAVREAVAEIGQLQGAWFPDRDVFKDASVNVWAPIIEARSASPTPSGTEPGLAEPGTEPCPAEAEPCPADTHPDSTTSPVTVFTGVPARKTATAYVASTKPTSWSPLLAARRGVPVVAQQHHGTLGDIADATADFRDQYYGLVGHVVDRPDHDQRPKLVTSGLIDPAHLLWGTKPTRFNKQKFTAPRVDLEGLDPQLRTWAHQRLVPKVLVAPQAPTLEAVVDEAGELLPSVPVVTLTSNSVSLWKLAALLSNPAITAIAATRHIGSALSTNALRLSAKDLLLLPLPRLEDPWDDAAAHFRQASNAQDPHTRFHFLLQCGLSMCSAYGCEAEADELMLWWKQRIPGLRTP